jgi:hypothetical protein
MHIFKTKDQKGKSDQLQGWHLDLVGMLLNWFLKLKSQMRTYLEIDTFAPFYFKWNDAKNRGNRERKAKENRREKQKNREEQERKEKET